MPGSCTQCKCIARTTGRQCRNKTCKFIPCCWMHTDAGRADQNRVLDAQLVKGLYIKKSTIPGAGCGLFTRHRIRKGSLIGLYTGKPQRLALPGAHYAIQCAGGKTIFDAQAQNAVENSALRYANRGTRLHPNNAKIGAERAGQSGQRGCRIVTKRPIPANGEILLAYGSSYRMDPRPASKGCRGRTSYPLD